VAVPGMQCEVEPQHQEHLQGGRVDGAGAGEGKTETCVELKDENPPLQTQEKFEWRWLLLLMVGSNRILIIYFYYQSGRSILIVRSLRLFHEFLETFAELLLDLFHLLLVLQMQPFLLLV
jgi:hypothetical protein